MNGLTNAGGAGGGLRVIAEGTFQTNSISLPEPAKLLIATAPSGSGSDYVTVVAFPNARRYEFSNGSTMTMNNTGTTVTTSGMSGNRYIALG